MQGSNTTSRKFHVVIAIGMLITGDALGSEAAIPVTIIEPATRIVPETTGPGFEFADFAETMAARDGVMVSAEQASQYAQQEPRPSRVHLLRGSVNGWIEEANFDAATAVDWSRHARSASVSKDLVIVGIGSISQYQTAQGGFRIYRHAQGAWSEVAHVDADALTQSKSFGASVAIDGSWAAAGDADNGKVVIYHADADASTWTPVQTLSAAEVDPAEFGQSLSLEGDELLVGAPGTNYSEEPTNLGAVAVFHLVAGTWQRVDTLPSVSTSGGSMFGWSIARHHDLLVVGARGNYSNDQMHGRAYVYRADAQSGTWSPAGFLFPSDTSSDDGFSRTVSTDGVDVAVGTDVDRAYLFRESYNLWNEYKVHSPAPPAIDIKFGATVAIPFSDALLIGAPQDSAPGAAFGGAVYEFSAGLSVDLTRRIDLGDAADRDQFGSTLDADGQLVAVGDPYDDDRFGLNTGSLSIYRVDYSKPEILRRLAKVTPPFARAPDAFGFAVSVSGNRIAALSTFGFQIETGASGQDAAAYVYRWNPADDTVVFEQRVAGPPGYYLWGQAVAMSGNLLAVGALGTSSYSPGSVFLYRFDSEAGLWALAQTLNATGDDPGYGFGSALAWCNGNLLVGGPTDQSGPGSTGGAAYIFSPDSGGTFTQGSKLIADDFATTNHFGNTLACTKAGSTVAVGNWTDAYLFERDASPPMAWHQVAQIGIPQEEDSEAFLASMRFSGRTLYAGVSPYFDLSPYETGSVYAVRKVEGVWQIDHRLRSSQALLGDAFGSRIAVLGSGLVASSPLRSQVPATNVGQIEAFGQLDTVFVGDFESE